MCRLTAYVRSVDYSTVSIPLLCLLVREHLRCLCCLNFDSVFSFQMYVLLYRSFYSAALMYPMNTAVCQVETRTLSPPFSIPHAPCPRVARLEGAGFLRRASAAKIPGTSQSTSSTPRPSRSIVSMRPLLHFEVQIVQNSDRPS